MPKHYFQEMAAAHSAPWPFAGPDIVENILQEVPTGCRQEFATERHQPATSLPETRCATLKVASTIRSRTERERGRMTGNTPDKSKDTERRRGGVDRLQIGVGYGRAGQGERKEGEEVRRPTDRQMTNDGTACARGHS